MWQFRAMAMDLGTIFEWDDFRKVLLKLAGEGRFASLRLFSYPDGPISDIVELPARARPLLAIQGGRYLDSGADGAGFPTSQILPSATDGPERGGTHIVYPLHFGGRHFGYIVTGVGRPEVGVLDFIQDQICVVIHNIWLMNELRTAQARLFQSEKMAALGNLVVGLAHEVNTPLGIGVTAASFLESELPVLRRKFEDGSLSRADLARHLEESQSSLELLRRNLERASVLVRNFKAIGAVQEILPAEQFDLRDCLQEIVQGMKPSLDEAAVRVALDGPPRLAMTGHPRALWQVVTHLIDNSLAHAFAPGAGGVIRLGFSQDERNVELTVSDDGHGIGTASLPRVFEPFFTTRRGQGNAGLGLSIVYHLVTSTLGGTIACSSPPGGGACFLIQIPRESGTPGSPPPGGPVLD
jgi:signal transduction histidine kinase